MIPRRQFPLVAVALGTAAHQTATANAYPAMIGTAGLRANAANLATYIANTYPGVSSIGGVRPDRLPDHPSGRAIDVMVGGNTALGNQIYADIMGNPGRFNISYALWQNNAAHRDHIHFSVRS